MRLLFVIFIGFFLFAFQVSAEVHEKHTSDIRIFGKQNSTVINQEFTLGDLAGVESKFISDDEAMIALQAIVLGKSPRAGKKKTISAAQVLATLREAGVELDSLRYAFPRVMTVERASRLLSIQEVESLVREGLPADGEIELVRVKYDGNIHVLPGPLAFSSEVIPSNRKSQYLAKISITPESGELMTLNIPLEVREYVQVPIAKHALPKGAIISSGDVKMARARLSDIPTDSAMDSREIVGQAIKYPISHGEVFSRRKLSLPAMVTRGARVTLRYRSSLLEATASGIALEEGALGQRIQVRNDSSKKMITGEVISPGLIEVTR